MQGVVWGDLAYSPLEWVGNAPEFKISSSPNPLLHAKTTDMMLESMSGDMRDLIADRRTGGAAASSEQELKARQYHEKGTFSNLWFAVHSNLTSWIAFRNRVSDWASREELALRELVEVQGVLASTATQALFAFFRRFVRAWTQLSRYIESSGQAGPAFTATNPIKVEAWSWLVQQRFLQELWKELGEVKHRVHGSARVGIWWAGLTRFETLVDNPRTIVEQSAISSYLAVNHASSGSGVMTAAKQTKLEKQVTTLNDYVTNHMRTASAPRVHGPCGFKFADGRVCGEDHDTHNHHRFARKQQDRLRTKSGNGE